MSPMRLLLLFIVLMSFGFDHSVSYIVQVPNIEKVSRFPFPDESQPEQRLTERTLSHIDKAKLAYYSMRENRGDTNCNGNKILCGLDWVRKVSGIQMN